MEGIRQQVQNLCVEITSNCASRFPHLVRNYNYSWLRWIFPQDGWIKCNSNGSLSKGGVATCGGVLRDSHGRWLGGFSRRLGSCSVLMA